MKNFYFCKIEYISQFHHIVKYLFITGGYPNYQKTELVSVDEGYPVPDCIQTLSEHPNELFYAAGGALPDRGEMSEEFFKFFFLQNLQTLQQI